MFDEVTSALDPELGHEVLQVMRELAVAETTMPIVTTGLKPGGASSYAPPIDQGTGHPDPP